MNVMNDKTFLFDATSLSKSKINVHYQDQFEQFCFALFKKLGFIASRRLRLCRVPTDESFGFPYKQYALIALQGEKSDCLIEVSCNTALKEVKWPQLAEIETGKRLCIEIVDWIDASLLINHFMALKGS
ncbi:hypothetical protein A9G48_04090 [Gilliamella sp. wkB18]|uniref:hypothetical protein n=1 Tax=Gilliamella sp. wkB18 TaxID=3120260 RepID=UPI00080E8839|nr:hypothetical protein [Gilliamella apicola]OCG64112.1 hypothetical protein A9G48_04090 [Gilliamella apicola]